MRQIWEYNLFQNNMPQQKKNKNIGIRLGNKSASKTDNVGSTPTIPAYKLTLKSLGRVYKSEGETLEEALNKLQISGGAKATAVLIAERGERKVEKIINGNYAWKLFGKASPTMRMIALKRMHDIFDL